MESKQITSYSTNDFALAVEMIRKAQSNLFYVAKTTLIDLYWNLGKHISERVALAGWGKGVVEELAAYIHQNEPNASGFSASNLWRMKQFYETYYSNEKLATVLREIAPKAQEVFRDTYVMEFITGQEAKPENSLRKTMLKKMKQLILELGKDFIAMEEEFQPEHLGQLNFYLEALDRDVRYENENPSIGVLLCKSKDDEVVEYALSRTLSPTLVAQYELMLPDKELLQKRVREVYEQSLELMNVRKRINKSKLHQLMSITTYCYAA